MRSLEQLEKVIKYKTVDLDELSDRGAKLKLRNKKYNITPNESNIIFFEHSEVGNSRYGFVVSKNLGSGSSGKVKKAFPIKITKDGKIEVGSVPYAIKSLKKISSCRDEYRTFINDAEVESRLNWAYESRHSNYKENEFLRTGILVLSKGLHKIDNKKRQIIKFHMLLPYATGKSLLDIIQTGEWARLSLLDQLDYALKLANEIKLLHQPGEKNKPIVYVDMSLSNIICSLKEKSIKFVDFGKSRYLGKDDSIGELPVGHYHITPPEIIKEYFKGEDNLTSTLAGDMYSFGAILSILFVKLSIMTKRSLNSSNSYIGEELRRETSKLYTIFMDSFPHERIEELSDVEKDIAKLVQALMSYDPANRPDIDQAIHKLTEFRNKIAANENLIETIGQSNESAKEKGKEKEELQTSDEHHNDEALSIISTQSSIWQPIQDDVKPNNNLDYIKYPDKYYQFINKTDGFENKKRAVISLLENYSRPAYGILFSLGVGFFSQKTARLASCHLNRHHAKKVNVLLKNMRDDTNLNEEKLIRNLYQFLPVTSIRNLLNQKKTSLGTRVIFLLEHVFNMNRSNIADAIQASFTKQNDLHEDSSMSMLYYYSTRK